MNQHFLEKCQLAVSFVPVNMATAANDGDWVNCANFQRCAIIFVGGAGAAGEDPTITVQQAKTAAGGSAKALNFTRIDRKQATAITAVGQWTTATQAAANTYTNDTLAELQKLVVIDIDMSTMDGENGFYFLQASVNDVGNTSQVGGCLYLLHDPRQQRAASDMPSVLA